MSLDRLKVANVESLPELQDLFAPSPSPVLPAASGKRDARALTKLVTLDCDNVTADGNSTSTTTTTNRLGEDGVDSSIINQGETTTSTHADTNENSRCSIDITEHNGVESDKSNSEIISILTGGVGLTSTLAVNAGEVLSEEAKRRESGNGRLKYPTSPSVWTQSDYELG
ncbi:hypothetical protein SARC_02880 [Sphaeroforma arctica JP610]|uniref:Uncharacterized protein n=1 Tax=Sphaeroforma arctica JP610 TaxID=667725 RepID=A0A0L0G7R0_9EUKA|nr:hypothetical protein SARC_02880 [Sphaeroforma arctica JP610]KNC84926.1 hypothetical protein SARC_02880 [Sphaeroforma arctica JP610]|eukprot:XP_014158828.1 hypothetical protein SARC_02880 [Sphaeroforma arctica JP610]